MTDIYGIDGCRKGWVAASKNSRTGSVTCRILRTIDDLRQELGKIEVIGIDIPVGLQKSGRRMCDIEARRLLGKRGSSIFDAPLREVLRASSYEEACEIRERIEQKRMSRQSWGIVRKVREIDDFRRENAPFAEVVHEVHPELSFSFMAGRRPMEHYKKTPEGVAERVALLSRHLPVTHQDIMDWRRMLRVPVDDLIDALAALWSAERVFRGDHFAVPVTGTHANRFQKISA